MSTIKCGVLVADNLGLANTIGVIGLAGSPSEAILELLLFHFGEEVTPDSLPVDYCGVESGVLPVGSGYVNEREYLFYIELLPFAGCNAKVTEGRSAALFSEMVDDYLATLLWDNSDTKGIDTSSSSDCELSLQNMAKRDVYEFIGSCVASGHPYDVLVNLGYVLCLALHGHGVNFADQQGIDGEYDLLVGEMGTREFNNYYWDAETGKVCSVTAVKVQL